MSSGFSLEVGQDYHGKDPSGFQQFEEVEGRCGIGNTKLFEKRLHNFFCLQMNMLTWEYMLASIF